MFFFKTSLTFIIGSLGGWLIGRGFLLGTGKGLWFWVLGGGIFSILLERFGFKLLTNWIKQLSFVELFFKCLGVLVGILFVALMMIISWPILNLMAPDVRVITFLLLTILCGGSVVMIFKVKEKEIMKFFAGNDSFSLKNSTQHGQLKILDTSAIIDGRIADLCRTGFLEGVLVIPNFVLVELQKIADSAEQLRRNRGRRGLDLLNKIQKENLVMLKIIDRDYDDLSEVDTKLLRLARELDAKVVTNDYNLNKVAELYGVNVLNINELSNAIKPVVIPGEEMYVHVLRDGKEYGQGIGYLEDGTMIVIEGGKDYIGMDISILVTSVLQTAAGRMIFAKPKDYLVAKLSS